MGAHDDEVRVLRPDLPHDRTGHVDILADDCVDMGAYGAVGCHERLKRVLRLEPFLFGPRQRRKRLEPSVGPGGQHRGGDRAHVQHRDAGVVPPREGYCRVQGMP
jgi:hypothetical protein